MPDYEDYDGIAAAIDRQVPDILKNDVFPVAEKILIKHIGKDIYDVYTPKSGGWFGGVYYDQGYSRRHVLENSIVRVMEDDNTMVVTSRARANKSLVNGYKFNNRYPGAFLEMLESGNTGAWRNGFARPAVSNAQKEVETSRAIESAIKKGLKRVTK